MLTKGDQVPVFELPDQLGKTFHPETMKGNYWILYFYPHDLTPTCTIQACNLRDNHLKLKKAGLTVVGINADSAQTHKRFIDKHKIPYRILVDAELEVARMFGVWGPKKFMGREFDGIHRTTFLINPEGKIEAVWNKPKSKQHAQEILEIFSSLSKT